MVTCNGNYSQHISDHQCSFAVQTVVCDDLVGDVSIAVTVPMIRADIEPTDSKVSSLNSYGLCECINVESFNLS